MFEKKLLTLFLQTGEKLSDMKIFTSEDIRSIITKSLEADGSTILELAEKVADGVAADIVARWRPTKRTFIFAGPGLNGVYGLATAKKLIDAGFNPEVFLFNIRGKMLSNECKRLRDQLTTIEDVKLTEVVNTFDPPQIPNNALVIDALFGVENQQPLAGGFVMLVRYINESRATVVSIDLPSGLFSDWNPNGVNRDIIHAHTTIAVGFPHLCFLMDENAELVGQWKVLDVGFNDEIVRETQTKYHLVERSDIKRVLHPRPEFCNKNQLGHAVLVAGSYGMVGASILAARGALRSGAGKVTVYSASCAFTPLQTAVPEAMFVGDKGKFMVGSINPNAMPFAASNPPAVGIGPGLGTSDATVAAVEAFIKSWDKPMVVDADALNIIASKRDLLNHLPLLSVLTPHDGEFDRLFDAQFSHERRVLKAVEMSAAYNILILLKGRYTALVRPDGKIFFNYSGNPGMATGGSGDVLTGVITGFMAQGLKPEVASIVGAFVHGEAGNLAAAEQGEYGMTSGDIASKIGIAIKNVMN